MVHRFVFHNDRIVPMDEARLSPGQSGVINGWGLFSTVRIYEGQPFAFERHWSRLGNDAARVGVPMEYSPEYVRSSLLQLIQANSVDNGCARVYLIHNKVGIWHSEEALRTVDLIMYTSDLPSRSGMAGLSLLPNGRHAAHPLAGAKVTAWLSNAWMVEQAHQRGFEDALLLNELGNVSECTAANVFAVLQGQLVTPPLSSGCLPGVTRQVLLEIAPQAGVSIKERDFSFDELKTADEVFITSTTSQVRGVSNVEDIQFASSPGPVTQHAAKLFADYVSDYVAAAKGKTMASKP